MINLTDTPTWLPLDGLARGFDANKAEPSTLLVDREVVVTDDRGTRITHRFSPDTVTWVCSPGAGDPIPESAGRDLLSNTVHPAEFDPATAPAGREGVDDGSRR